MIDEKDLRVLVGASTVLRPRRAQNLTDYLMKFDAQTGRFIKKALAPIEVEMKERYAPAGIPHLIRCLGLEDFGPVS